MLFSLGRIQEAKAIIANIDDPIVFEQCGDALEKKGMFNDAAMIYEQNGQIKKAALMYLQANNLTRAKAIIDDVCDGEVNYAFAKAHERLKRFDTAIQIYEQNGFLYSLRPFNPFS